MYVEIDQNSGFCFGVVRAISRAESALEALGGEVYSLGDIVHNRMEVQRLESLGLRTVNHEDMESLRGATSLSERMESLLQHSAEPRSWVSELSMLLVLWWLSSSIRWWLPMRR